MTVGTEGPCGHHFDCSCYCIGELVMDADLFYVQCDRNTQNKHLNTELEQCCYGPISVIVQGCFTENICKFYSSNTILLKTRSFGLFMEGKTMD